MIYEVIVKVFRLETWEVEADSPEQAMENWKDGELTSGSDEPNLEAEPLEAKVQDKP